MSFKTRMQAVAQRLTETYGELCSFTRTVEGVFIPTTGETGAGTISTYTAYGHPGSYSIDEIDNSTALSTDIRLIIELTSTRVVPLVGDVVSLNSTTYRVMSVNSLKAQGSDIAYILQLRI